MKFRIRIPDWTTPKHERPRCGAKTRSGRPCIARAVWDKERDCPTTRNARCRMHGGTNRGPVTEEGKARSLEALRRANEARRKKAEGGRSDGGSDAFLPPILPLNLEMAAKLISISVADNARKVLI